MLPTGEEEPDPLNETVKPLTDVVNTAVGAWSGVMPMPYGRDGTATDCVDWAIGRPLLLTACPVKITVVEVPTVLVTVKEILYTPPPAYV